MTFGVLKRGAKSMNQSPYAGSLASWHSLWSLCSHHSACRTAKVRGTPISHISEFIVSGGPFIDTANSGEE
jgi:hypothetical protein